ncbi:procathepsin L isoform X2 [Halyomorpha halys]|nr:cathepsin L1-like isoform X2 [Halyomorpha halys]XP_014290893.1 cathepsin L1-like isoform X2 [Halyomorpha halys]KAE8573732.1 Cat4 [Halyomorpha halys]
MLSAFLIIVVQIEEDEWNAYKDEYGKNYATKEQNELRKNIYFDNKIKIDIHNALYDKGIKTYELRINKFTDMTSKEIRKLMNGYIGNQKQTGELYVAPANETLPESVDWRQKGAITPVKDQRHFGSCWAFSATGSIESQHFFKTGELLSLSVQNLMDCSKEGGNGSSPDKAFEYVKKNNGIDTEESYPYEAKNSEVCKFNKSTVGATVTGYKLIPRGDELALQSSVANFGPVSVAIDASHTSFHHYHSGIYFEEDCSSTDLDHGVLVVGYGSENGTDYWLVKNSWGEDWGVDGYIKMTRNRNNCGIATCASYPLVNLLRGTLQLYNYEPRCTCCWSWY